jgi:hypothetical protein
LSFINTTTTNPEETDMIAKVTELFSPDTETTLEYVRHAVERTARLAQSQMEVAQAIYDEVSREYRELLSTTEPTELFRIWPGVLATTARSTTEGSAILMQNAIRFQNEMLQMMQSKMPDMNKQLMERFLETMRAAAITAEKTQRDTVAKARPRKAA